MPSSSESSPNIVGLFAPGPDFKFVYGARFARGLYALSILGLTNAESSSSLSSFAKTTVFFAVAVGRLNVPPGKPGKGGGVF